MCGRYAIVPGSAAWASLDEVLGPGLVEALRSLEPRYNVAPSQQVPIIYMDRDSRELRVALARWGFVPHWWKDDKLPPSTINARSEEAPTKPMWRNAWQQARCLIPATHWYEWQRQADAKRPHALTVGDGTGFMFAGLFSYWTRPDGEALLSCAILTRAAAPDIADVHDRMPLVLKPQAWRTWVDRNLTDVREVKAVLESNAELDVLAYPISTLVNSPRNQGADILRPAVQDGGPNPA